MAKTTNAHRELYRSLFGEHASSSTLRTDDDPEAVALEALLRRVEAVQRDLDVAYAAARARGEPGTAIFKEARRAAFLAGAIRDALVDEEDQSDEIASARGELDAVNDRLDALPASSEALADDLGAVEGTLTALAKFLKLLG